MNILVNLIQLVIESYILLTNEIFSDAPTEIPKYKSPNSEVSLSVENSNNVGTSDDSNIDKLRVNLFSGWGENSSKGENNTSDKLERSQHVSLVNYSTSDTSEVEMLDSSTTHIEYN